MMGYVDVSIKRFAPQRDEEPWWQSFKVPVFDKMNVLDVAFWVQRNAEPSLAFRCACRVGMCGSCGMVINGSEGLGCRTLVASLGERLRLEPMRHMPVVRDLVVDMGAFYQRYRRVMPYFVTNDPDAGPARVSGDAKERRQIGEHRECINCGLCLSSCDVAGMGSDFLGPAALNRAYVLVADSRDAERKVRLRLVSNEAGLWRCHTLFNCTAVCPKGIPITEGIQRLKRKATVDRLKRALSLSE